MILALMLAADLCAGRVTDKINHPMLPYVLDPTTLQPIQGKPPVGKPFLDPSFGTIITRIAAPELPGSNAVLKPMYSTVQPLNADESLLVLWHRGRGHQLRKGDGDYAFIRWLDITPTDLEHFLWDPVEPLVFYYPRVTSAGRSQMAKVTLGPQPGYASSEEVLFDFTTSGDCPQGVNHNVNRFGLGSDPEANLQPPRKLVGLMCGAQGVRKIIYSIAENKVYSRIEATKVGPQAPIVTPSEQNLFIAVANMVPRRAYLMALNWSVPRTINTSAPFEHSMVGADDTGDTWNTIAFNESSTGANDSGTLVSHRLDTLQPRVIIGPATGFPYIASGTHISTTGPKGWVFVGSVGGAHSGQFTGDNELMLANTDTGKVCRIGHNRTWAGTNCGPLNNQCVWGYWGETHGALSRKGNRAFFGSDWQGSDSVDTYVIDLRRPPIRIRTTTNCAILSLTPFQASDCRNEGSEVVP